MADHFSRLADEPGAPARQMFLITPGANPIDPLPKALRANGAGTITLVAVDSAEAVTIDVVAGEIVPVRAEKVTAATVVIHGLA